MNRIARTLPVLVLLALAWASIAAPAAAARKGDRGRSSAPSTRVKTWLVLGPAAQPLPAFHDDDRHGFGLDRLLDETILTGSPLRPAAGESLLWFSGERLAWSARESEHDGMLILDRSGREAPAVAWAATYLETDRWQSVKLRVTGDHPRRAWLDGQPVAKGGTDPKDGDVEGNLELTTGKHLLLLETVLDPQRANAWSIGAVLETDDDETPLAVTPSVSRVRPVNLADILDAPGITSLAVSPRGGRVAVGVSRVLPGTADSESWVEIRRTTDGAPVESWRGQVGARSVAWSPDGKYVSYLAASPGKKSDSQSSLYLHEVGTGNVVPLLEGVEEMGDYLWSPTGDAIVYSMTVKAEKDERGVKIVEGLMDRWASYRDKSYLHLVSVPDGARRTLTAGALTTSPVAFAPDGRHLLFSRQVEDVSERPYTHTELYELDLETLETRKLRDFGWFNGAAYSPDGSRLLVAADAAAFGPAGLNLPENVIPNSYDTQLFVWDPETDEVDAITRTFAPSVTSFAWSRDDGRIYLTAEDEDLVRLFRWDREARAFVAIDTGYQRVSSLELARSAPLAVVLGSSPWTPQTLVAVDLAATAARTLEHPGQEWFRDVDHGGLEQWDFTASSGRTIVGRVYLPPGFDPAKKYPAIVYYYGGTSPVTREFGGRYPKEWWASNGYVVYVPQPSGATGFGQASSALHVNDWGRKTSEEIIEGTRAFLEAHAYVDPTRVGCIGASYGGFMTMLLSTETDLFRAAVAHAGISSLASYWGEGYWGALYSAVATAESFPWNRPDLYIDQSPLFRADKNRVPILLTHGAADTNVPVGESDQFYIALRLLGKDVEYLQVAGQDHFIMEHDKRRIWSSSIVAWFDRWLKDRPGWWNHLWPSRPAPDRDHD